MNELNKVQDEIAEEVSKAVTKFPNWPTDPFHAFSVVSEEYGELAQAMLQHVYEPEKGVSFEDIEKEAIQLGAMCVRFLTSVREYEFKKGKEHGQQL